MKIPRIKRGIAILLCAVMTFGISIFTAIESVADDTVTVDKQLLSFSGCDTGTAFALPDRMKYINGSNGFNYNGTKSIEETAESGKYFNLALNKSVKKQTNDTVGGRDKRMAFSVSVPANYVKYIDTITLNYSNNVNQKDTYTKMYTVIGITDGVNYGKTVKKSIPFSSGENGKISVAVSDMLITNEAGFLGSCGSNKWSDAETDGIASILVYITMPYCKGRENWAVGIKGLTVTLKGNAGELENIDTIAPEIENFDKFDTLEELKQNGTFVANGDFELTDKADSAPNALLYKGKKDSGTDYDSSLEINLDKRVSEVKGLTFKVFNLSTQNNAVLRCFLDTKSGGKNKTCQYITTAKLGEDGFTRVRIYFDNVGEKTGDEFWGGTSSGYSMTDEEIRNITKLRIRIPDLLKTDAGVAFDSFEYIVEDDRLLRNVTLVDFDNCEPGGDAPEGIKVEGSYNGTVKVVEKSGGKKALRVYYDAAAGGTTDKINERSYVAVTVNVPKGTLRNSGEIRAKVTNNAVSCEDSNRTPTNIYYLITVNGGGYYGRYGMNHWAPKAGEQADCTVPTTTLYRISSGWSILNWFNTKNVPYWSAAELDEVDKITVYITAPACKGNEGWSFDLDLLELFYTEIPEYSEGETRKIALADTPEKTSSENISAEISELTSNDKNYRKFSRVINIETKNAENTEPAVILNRCCNYLRNLAPFTDTATLFMYARADKDTELKINMVTKSGGKMPFTVNIKASEKQDFGEYEVKMAEVIKAYNEQNPNTAVSLNDIYAFELLPVAAEPSLTQIACLTLWTKEVGNTSASNSYYYYDNGVAVEAYSDYLLNTDIVKIESFQAAGKISEWGIKVPEGLTPLLFKTVSLYDKDGVTKEPKNNIWLTFDLPNGTNLNQLSFYKVFFDGSLLKTRYVIEGDKLSVNTFTVGSYIVFAGKVTEATNPDNTEEVKPVTPEIKNTDSTDYSYDSDKTDESPDDGEEETEQIIKRRKMMRKKKSGASADEGLPVWAIVCIAAAAVIVVCGAVFTVVIIKRKKRGTVK